MALKVGADDLLLDPTSSRTRRRRPPRAERRSAHLLRCDKLVHEVVLVDDAPFAPLIVEKRKKQTEYGAKAVRLSRQRYRSQPAPGDAPLQCRARRAHRSPQARGDRPASSGPRSAPISTAYRDPDRTGWKALPRPRPRVPPQASRPAPLASPCRPPSDGPPTAHPAGPKGSAGAPTWHRLSASYDLPTLLG